MLYVYELYASLLLIKLFSKLSKASRWPVDRIRVQTPRKTTDLQLSIGKGMGKQEVNPENVNAEMLSPDTELCNQSSVVKAKMIG